VLAFAPPGKQHDLPVGELPRIVMHARFVERHGIATPWKSRCIATMH
jgi:hypothetical protein